MEKRPHSHYVVELPEITIPGIHNINRLELVLSTSDKGAVSHAISRKVSKDLIKDKRHAIIGHAVNVLTNNYGGAKNHAFEIQEYIQEEGGRTLSKFDPAYKQSQIGFLASEISKKKGRNEIDCLPLARKYWDLYNKGRSINQ
ncbi:hypothetical protein KAJ38_02800 [Candidatus Pacearchaeota archaeon]|nr:hypothetical protein [Candidatus Pacearchaeota archaeon]